MRFYPALFFCMIASFETLTVQAQNKQDKEGFMLVKKQGSIAIFERWVIYPGSKPPQKAREIKGEFYYNNTIYAGLNLLQNEKKIKEWQSHVAEFKIYPQRDTSTWFEYSYHDIPWPVSDQDHFMEYRISKREPNKIIVISFKSKINDKLAPVREDVSRMELSGSWTMEQISATKVKVTYRISSRPIGIPKIFTDPIIRGNIMTTIEQYIALLEKK